MAAERTVVVRIKAEYRAFEASMKAAARAAEQASEKIDASGKKSSSALGQLLLDAKQHEQSWNVAGGAMLGFGAAVVGMVGVSVAKYAAFDKAMSSVRAATHASKGDMDALREAAIKAGADTAFSAEEAAKGIEELAKAGVSTKDILGGGLAGALNLAAAGELAVGEAAEIAASAMTQFKLSGDQIPHLADLLAAGAGKAQGSVTDMGAALNQSGLVAASTGLTIEETTGALAAFASAGLTGSDAGTSFKTMLQSLNPNSDKAAAIMEDLGISAYDAGGEFIGMSEYAGKLQGALKDMSAEQRNATLKTLFGSDAVRAANVLYEQGAEGIQKWEDQVNAAGYAAQTAAIMQDNLAGDVEKLGGAFDTVFLKSGKGANDVLRGMVSRAEDVVDAVGKIPGPILSSVTGFAGIVGATALVAGGFMTLVPKAIETWGAFRDLGTAGSKIPGNFGKVTKAAGVAAGAFILLQAAVAANNATAPEAKGVEEFIDGYNKLRESATSMDDTFKNMEFAKGSSLEGKITNLGDALSELSPRFGDVGRHLGSFGATVLGAENGLPQMKREIEGLSDAMATAATGGDIEGASKVFREMVASAEAGGKGLADLTPYMGSYLDSLREIANQYGANISEGELMVWALEGIAPASVAAAQGAESAAAGLEEIGVSAEGAVTELDKLVQAMFAMSDGTLNVRAATRGFQEAIDGINESIKENGKSLDETTPKGRANAAALDAVAQGGKDIASAMASAKDANGNFVHTQEEVQTSLKGTYDATYAAARAFGLGKTESAAMARELLGIPKDVSVDTWIADTAKNGADATKDAVNGIPDMKGVTVIVTDQGTVSVTAAQIQSIKDRTVSTQVTDDGTILTVQGGINNIEGTTEQIIVSDDGTVQVVQARINKTTGKTEYIRVSDGGTVSGVQGLINSITGKTVEVHTRYTSSGDRPAARGPGGSGGPTAFRGMRIPKHSNGARMPYTGLGTDKILGINSDGIPSAWVDDGEWVINERASNKHHSLLKA
ncbi:MAG TPA: phage tail tape measure protein, partial [Micrococcaceae bacterium]|nr:phage tail tape measure protein [Micrococcaceae bacterium]